MTTVTTTEESRIRSSLVEDLRLRMKDVLPPLDEENFFDNDET